MKEMRLAYLLGLNACNTAEIILHSNDRVVAAFIGHVIIIYDGHLV